MVVPLEVAFPGLAKGDYRVTSPSSKHYNCIAWAADQCTNWWWPVPLDAVWPFAVAREETLEAFQLAFGSIGYVECQLAEAEPGIEKVAIFASPDGEPLHAARQLSSGKWTSKLGEKEDIEHSLYDLEGEQYGSVVLVLKRAIQSEIKHKLVVGLVGGIGSGKSRVAAEFARHRATVISGDALGHEALRQPEIQAKVIERFGAGIAAPSGEIDRRKLAAVVFANAGELRDLEKLVFPWIEHGLHEQVAIAQRNPASRLIVVDAAVMFEAGWNKFCDIIVYVHAPREQRLARLAQHRSWTAEQMQARSLAQMPLTNKVTRADVAIDNSGPEEALASQVERFVATLQFSGCIRSGF